MKKVTSLLLAAVLMLSLLAGCAGGSPPPAETTDESTANQSATTEETNPDAPTLAVWSFTEELPKMINDYYLVDFPGAINMEFTMIDGAEFESKLDPALASGQGPDIWGQNVAGIKKYVEGGVLADMSDFVPQTEEMQIADYVVSLGTDSDGVLRSLSNQATPGGLWYRRSIAEEYLGVSEPEDVQPLVSDMEKMAETAAILKEKSDGSVYFSATINDFWMYHDGDRTGPFVENETINMDPAISAYFETSKLFLENNWLLGIDAWQQDWFASMSDSLNDANGNPIQIFSYADGTWFNFFVLEPNAKSADGSKDTTGDWGLVPGPNFFFSGGTFWCVNAASDNLDATKELFGYLNLSEDFLSAYCRNTGDYPASGLVAEKLEPEMANENLGGQNAFTVFNSIVGNIEENYSEKYFDEAVRNFMNAQALEYANGNKDLDTALADYKESLMGQYPDIQG